jgi:HlyD family secretion protein
MKEKPAIAERVASPERLGGMLPVTDGRGWAAMGGIGTLLLAAMAWGVAGRIPLTVAGTGILVKSGGVLEVIPVAGGLVGDVAVEVGEMVNEGQIVARIIQPEVSTRVQIAKATLADLRERRKQLAEFGDNNMRLQRDNLARQRSAAEQSIIGGQDMVRWAKERIRIQAGLVDKGLLLPQAVLETREKEHQALEQIGKARSDLAAITAKEVQLRNELAERLAESDSKVAEAERTVDQTGRELQAKSQVVTPYTGRILEVLTEKGKMVEPGEAILRLDLAGRSVRGLEVVIFVPSSQGKQIKVGMPTLIAPATTKVEEYGFMLAKVSSVSDFPATVKGMEHVLKNEKLVEALAGSDAPYEIHADLVVDPTTVSQYRWSSSKGPAERIHSGTLASARVAVAYCRPLQLLLPIFGTRCGL